jgi:hypothetical protein
MSEGDTVITVLRGCECFFCDGKGSLQWAHWIVNCEFSMSKV